MLANITGVGYILYGCRGCYNTILEYIDLNSQCYLKYYSILQDVINKNLLSSLLLYKPQNQISLAQMDFKIFYFLLG